MTEQDKLREAIKAARAYEGRLHDGFLHAPALHLLADAAEQSLTFRRLPLPGDLDDKVLRAMWDAAFDDEPMKREPAMREAYKALYEHLTKPKSKMVDVWRVEFVRRIPGAPDDPCAVTYLKREDAEQTACGFLRGLTTHVCVRVTGPHQQEMPT